MKIQNLRLAMTPRRTIGRIARAGLVATAALVLTGSLPTARANHANTTIGMTLAGAPLAIHGYDPVAYFSESRARVGKAVFTATHDGVAYRFVSEANKAKFESNPERFAPQFGGYCAFGVSVGAKFDGDPNLFKVVDDKLYFNLNPDIQQQWQKDIPGNIAKADRNWTEIRDKSPEELK